MLTRCYAVTDFKKIDAIRSDLGQRFDSIREITGVDEFHVLDSFDWRLFNKGCLMLKRKDAYVIVDIHLQQDLHRLQIDDDKPRAFHWDFPASGLKQALEAILEMRALLPLSRIQLRFVRYDLLNRDKKTVARLVLDTYGEDNQGDIVSQFRIMPLKGYSKAAGKVADCMQRAGLQYDKRFAILTVLEQQGLSPGAYSSKINVSLKPEMPAAAAIQRLMANLVSVMKMNLPGLQQDIDSEFLHDFRVSVRRARSLLSQMKGVLDAETTAALQGRLKKIGALTGSVRDLDVYLMKETQYTDMLPPVLRPGIMALFQSLHNERRHERCLMLKAMGCADFADAIAHLDGFAQSDPAVVGTGGPNGKDAIVGLAKAAISKRYRRIIRKGGQITDATEDEELHALRIDCKKLRYLLEFFSSLFAETEVKSLIKQLKQLQDNLGNFNDLAVQQQFLVSHLEAGASKNAILAAATGGLITRLYMEHRQVRSQFLQVFKAFGASENQQRFKALFSR